MAKQHLIKARNVIDVGWTQRAFGRDGSGKARPAASKSAVMFCAAGAMRRAHGGRHVGADYKCDLNALGFESEQGLSDWNDTPQTSRFEVLARFDKAIAESEP